MVFKIVYFFSWEMKIDVIIIQDCNQMGGL